MDTIVKPQAPFPFWKPADSEMISITISLVKSRDGLPEILNE
jgi:hypothetical protein